MNPEPSTPTQPQAVRSAPLKLSEAEARTFAAWCQTTGEPLMDWRAWQRWRDALRPLPRERHPRAREHRRRRQRLRSGATACS